LVIGQSALVNRYFPSFVIRHSSFGIRQSAIGNRQSAIGIRHSAFGNRQSAIGISLSPLPLPVSVGGERSAMNVTGLQQVSEQVVSRLPAGRVDAAIVLGSGWTAFAAALHPELEIAYADIPMLGSPHIAGHRGRMLVASIEGRRLLVFDGRRHAYEGEGWEPVVLPVFVALAAGAPILLLTNASGGIRRDLHPGDLLVVDDHINFMGGNPLCGCRHPRLGLTFTDQSRVYDPELRRRLDACAVSAGGALPHGVYLAVSGPTYETPAEVAAFGALGADAVGMSTVPEAMTANWAGLRVAAVSFIANRAASIAERPLSHEDVLRETTRAQDRMTALLRAFCATLPAG
jgi:purine-nucleoside phosphorylase